MHAHPTCTLHTRFENDPGGPPPELRQGLVDAAGVDRRASHLREERGERGEERVPLTHGHRAEGVPVVGAFQGDEDAPLGLARVLMGLQDHLHGHFHGRGAVIRVEDTLQARGRRGEEFLGQADGRLVGAARKENVIEGPGLGGEGLDEAGVRVAVQAGPPRRDGIEKLAAVLEHEHRRPGACDGKGVRLEAVLGVGVPHDAGVTLRERTGLVHARGSNQIESRS